ncbi:XRE family transcriptional regulator [Demequina sp.]|uniref:helix-turn-helix domain-containing protein n=1 Tax=Demequina sp. TaxID=2050685 RepID=UPI0025BB2F36|nr:XRE family transcriptional regulator [Demequina sp.]
MGSVASHVGPRLRALRHARGLTLEELAARAQLSPSTLSRLESGKRQATLELLLPLTRQLGVRIDDLLPEADVDPRVRRPVIKRDGLVIAPLSPEGSALATYRITYPPAGEEPSLKVHEGHQWLYVLSGRLRLRLGEQEFVLAEGEAAEFDTGTPHAITSAGRRPVQALAIFGVDGARVHTHVATDPERNGI